MSKRQRKKKEKYWYMYFVGECPLCGKDASYKERRYTKKPKKKKSRVLYMLNSTSYCGCCYYL